MLRICRIENQDCLNARTNKPIPRIEFVENLRHLPKGTIIHSRDAVDATLDELTHICDQRAESYNEHEFCGVHETLGRLLTKQVGEKKTTEIMLEIARHGGIQHLK